MMTRTPPPPPPPSRVHARILIAGNSGVGKSSFFLRMSQAPDADDPIVVAKTIEPRSIYMTLKQTRDSRPITVELLDTAGEEKYAHLMAGYYRHVNGVILMYSVTDPESFAALRTRWLPTIKENCAEDVVVYLVANKIDTWTPSQLATNSRFERRRMRDLKKDTNYQSIIKHITQTSFKDLTFATSVSRFDAFIYQTAIRHVATPPNMKATVVIALPKNNNNNNDNDDDANCGDC